MDKGSILKHENVKDLQLTLLYKYIGQYHMFSPLGICYYYNDLIPVLLKYQASLSLFLKPGSRGKGASSHEKATESKHSNSCSVLYKVEF